MGYVVKESTGAPVLVTRTFRCKICKTQITVRQMRDDVPPECETCHGDQDWQPGGFTITGAKSKAVDVVQQIAEREYGLTDMKDSTREGESVVKLTPMQNKMADNFFGGQSVQIGQNSVPATTLLANAKDRSAPDPIAALKRIGPVPTRYITPKN